MLQHVVWLLGKLLLTEEQTRLLRGVLMFVYIFDLVL